MNRRTPLLLALLALIAGILWFVTSETSTELPDQALTVEEPDAAKPEAQAPAELAPAPVTEQTAAESSEREALAVEQSSAPQFAVPTDALWIRGRLTFPADTPVDEALTIVARGKRFGKGREAPNEHRVKLAADGTFQLAFAKSTRKGSVKLESRYLYLPESVRIEVKGFEGELSLEPLLGGRFTGTVEPEIALGITPDIFDNVNATVARWAEQDYRRTSQVQPDGRFELNAIPPGTEYEVEVTSARHQGSTRKPLHVKAGETLDLTFTLQRGVQIAGRVAGTGGVGVKGASVTLELTSQSRGRARTTFHTTRTGADGGFEYTGEEPGNARLKIKADGYREFTHGIGQLKNGEASEGLLLTPPLGSFVAGLVRWPDGKPAADVRVMVRQSKPGRGPQWDDRNFSTDSDDDGHFRLDGLGEGLLVIEASGRPLGPDGKKLRGRERGPLWKARLSDQEPGLAGLLLELTVGETLTGTVQDDAGHPVTTFTLELHAVSSMDDFGHSWSGRVTKTFTDDAGAFELVGLQGVSWKLRVRPQAGPVTSWQTIELPASAPLELVAPRGVDLIGVVLTPSGEPVLGASVTTESLEAAPFRARSGRKGATTGTDGVFELRGVASGELLLSASAAGWSSTERMKLETTSGSEFDGLQLFLRAASRLTGEVHAAAGIVADRHVTLYHRESRTFRSTQTDDQGQFAFEELEPGTYTAKLYSADDDPRTAIDEMASLKYTPVDVEIEEARTSHVVLGRPPLNPIRVFGLVTAAGKPIANISVRASGNGGGGRTTTNNKGEYDLLVGAPGLYFFNVGLEGNEARSTEEIKDVTEHRADFDLGTGSISGTVRLPGGDDAVKVQIRLDATAQFRFPARTVRTDNQGGFMFGYLPPETYVLTVGGTARYELGGADYALFRAEGFKLTEGQSLANIEVQLTEPGSVTGTVYESSGAPARGVWLLAKDSNGAELSSRRLAQTGRDGRFEVKGLPGGPMILATLKAGQIGGNTPVDVIVGGTVDIVIRLEDQN